MLPRVILHNIVSVDGRIDWLKPDIGQFYELASHWNEDATLVGSDTILLDTEGIDDTAMDSNREEIPQWLPVDDARPLLVIPDSRGRLRNWHLLKKMPHWRHSVALCSNTTPKAYLDYLDETHIDYIIRGVDHVDLREALSELNVRYDVNVVRVDSGGVLNGVLLRAGLVDEVSVLIDPCLVGGVTPRSLFRAPDLASFAEVIHLRLTHIESVRGDIVWLRYKVIR